MWRGTAAPGTHRCVGSYRMRWLPVSRVIRRKGFGSEEGAAGTYQLQTEMLRGELHPAHGALGVHEHGALDPSC